MRKDSMSSEQFNRYKGYAVNNDPKVYTTNLGLITINPDSWDDGYVLLNIDGKDIRMSVTVSFFNDLMKILNINRMLRRKMGQGKDNKDFSNLLNALKVIQNSHNPTQVSVIFDQVKNRLTHITNTGVNRLANVEVFNFADALLNQNPQLILAGITGSEDSSDFEIRLLSSNEFDFGDDDQFQFGITLYNKGLYTGIGDYAWRLVCTNGMYGIRTDERMQLTGTTETDLRKLFEMFDTMKSNNFLPHEFEGNLELAKKVVASLAELQEAVNNVASGIVGEFPEQKQQWVEGMISQYFPAYNAVMRKLKSKGYDIADLSVKQKQLIRTDMTVWDMVNALTYLGSNPTPFTLTNKNTLQGLGGKMFSEEFDLKDMDLIYL